MSSSISRKTEVISILFQRMWPDGSPSPLTQPMIVTNDDVVTAIQERNRLRKGQGKQLSDKNPANFLKDFIRKPSCNTNWPSEIAARKITARQRYGDQQVFEFVGFRAGDDLPFPDRYEPDADIPVFQIESLSIPRQARVLGRPDEPWLIQTVVSQRIAQTHFAVMSNNRTLDLTHLQMSVKTQPEIDAIYVATVEIDSREVRTLITCEAKQYGERLLEDQIREQVQQAFGVTSHLVDADAIEAVIPIAVQVIKHKVSGKEVRGIYFVEFNLITRSDFTSHFGKEKLHEMPLDAKSKAFYILKPDVQGISTKPPKNKAKKAPATTGAATLTAAPKASDVKL